MTQQTVALKQSQISLPFAAGVGAVVTLTPSGGSAYLQYTTGSAVDIQNNQATWTTWAKGTVTTAASDTAAYPMFVRAWCLTGNATLVVNDPDPTLFPVNALIPWKSLQPGYAVDALSNVSQMSSRGTKLAPPLSGDPRMFRAQAAFIQQQRGLGRYKVGFIGDSTTVGAYANGSAYTGNRTNAMPDLMAAALNAQGFTNTNVNNTFGDNNSSAGLTTNTYDTRISLGSGWGYGGGGVTTWAIGGNLISNNTNSNRYSFTPATAFDTIEVWYIVNATYGGMSIAVDNGSIIGANVDCAVGGADGTLLKVTRTTTLGTHKVDLFKTVSGDSKFINPCAINCYNSTSPAIELWNTGIGGASTTDWSRGTTLYNLVNVIPALACDLWFINLGINDALASLAVGTYTTQMQTIITAAKLTGSVVLYSPNAVSGTSLTAYRDAAAALAITNGLPFVDILARWTPYTTMNASGYITDVNHPNLAGYNTQIQPWLTPWVIQQPTPPLFGTLT